MTEIASALNLRVTENPMDKLWDIYWSDHCVKVETL
jgi:hypothetical protein